MPLSIKDFIAIILVLLALIGWIATSAGMKTRIDILEKQVANLPPEWLKDEINEVKTQITELQRSLRQCTR